MSKIDINKIIQETLQEGVGEVSDTAKNVAVPEEAQQPTEPEAKDVSTEEIKDTRTYKPDVTGVDIALLSAIAAGMGAMHLAQELRNLQKQQNNNNNKKE